MSLLESAELVTTVHAATRKKLTIEEFLALPDDGIDRMLLDGELWEVGLTLRSHLHAEVAGNVATFLGLWSKAQPRPRGKMVVGDAGFRLEPGESMVGPDVAYASAELIQQTVAESAYYDGAPTLAVEILSPSDRIEDVVAKVRKYLRVGTVVWEVNPEYQTVLVHRPGQTVEVYNITQELVGDPYLPGFRVAVAEFFAD